MVMVKESADTLLAALVGVTSSGKVPVGSLLSLALAVVHVSMSRWCSSYCCLCTYGYTAVSRNWFRRSFFRGTKIFYCRIFLINQIIIRKFLRQNFLPQHQNRGLRSPVRAHSPRRPTSC